jgi:monoamine oxidase
MIDVMIIGAGMAGLSAALELKRHGIAYRLLEAQSEISGRALTRCLPSSATVDLGAHWLHGKKNPLKTVLESYRIPYRKDKTEHVFIYQHGKVTKSRGTQWLDDAVDAKKAKRIEEKEASDCPITELAINERSREILRDFATMWNGIDPPLEPSAKEFLSDESTPGGLQPEGGMKALMDAMAALHEVSLALINIEAESEDPLRDLHQRF